MRRQGPPLTVQAHQSDALCVCISASHVAHCVACGHVGRSARQQSHERLHGRRLTVPPSINVEYTRTVGRDALPASRGPTGAVPDGPDADARRLSVLWPVQGGHSRAQNERTPDCRSVATCLRAVCEAPAAPCSNGSPLRDPRLEQRLRDCPSRPLSPLA
jgi:hypothetical protein